MEKKNKIILIISLFIAGLISFLASSSPDGLERVAFDKGFDESARNFISGLISDYAVPGINNGPLAAALAGIVGTILTFCLALFLGKAMIKLLNYEN